MPKVWTFIEAEQDVEDLQQLPMTRMIYDCLSKIENFSEDKILTIHDWNSFMGSLEEASSKYPLNILTFEIPSIRGIFYM